jgi:hypothetical protein
MDMNAMPRILVMSVCAAMLVAASSADARRVGGARSIGAVPSGAATARAPEAATTTISYSPRVQAPVATAAPRPESATARTVTGFDTKTAVVAGVTVAAARASLRNAQADGQDGSGSPSSQSVSSRGFQTVSAPASSRSSTQSQSIADGKPSKDPDLDRERAAEALAVRMFDRSAEKAVELMEKPKSVAELARENRLAAEKAAAARVEEERKMKLAREASCQIHPVMSDKAIANCQKVFREPS